MYFNIDVSKVSAASETLRPILRTTGRHISKDDIIIINGNTATYRGADKSLAQATSRSILFDGENISFDASLVIRI
jgi:catalase (peroxidase I)